jgi:hypothetical protein
MTAMDMVCRLPATQKLAVGHKWRVDVPVSGANGDLVIANATVSAAKLYIPQRTNIAAAYTYFGPVQQTADLQLKVSAGWLAMKKKTGNGPGGHHTNVPAVGYKFSMTVIVKNLGPGTATGLVLTVDAGSFANGCTCTKALLAPGKSWTTTYGSGGQVVNPTATTVSASVAAGASVYDPNLDNNWDGANPPAPGTDTRNSRN